MPGGPDPFAEGPDDPEPDDALAGGGTGDPPTGWVPPADRTWRHPSELGRTGAGTTPSLAPLAGGSGAALAPWPRSYGPHHRVATVCVAAIAIMAVTVGSLLLVKTGEGPGTPEATLAAVAGSVTASASCCTVTAAVVHRTAGSVVALARPTAPTKSIGGGVVLAGAGLVATTADAVAGHRVLRVTTAGGRRLTATVVAIDPGSDVAVLSVPAMLEPARFADDTDVGPGFPSAVLVPGTGGHGHAMQWSTATVRSVGTALPEGPGAGMAAIMVGGATGPALTGEPLLDAQGDVMGILDRAGSTTGPHAVRAYLPAPLVVGVARQLAMTGKVRHGWLGLVGEDAGTPTTGLQTTGATTGSGTTGMTTGVPTASTAGSITTTAATAQGPAGAEVVGVEPDGPSARVLQPGDVIVALDGRPVRSLAELRARLYVLPPGSRTTIGAVRAGQPLTATVRLAASP